MCHHHCPQAGWVSPGCSPLTVADGRRALPCWIPRQVGWSEVLIQAKLLWGNKEGKRREACNHPSITSGARAVIVNALALSGDKVSYVTL